MLSCTESVFIRANWLVKEKEAKASVEKLSIFLYRPGLEEALGCTMNVFVRHSCVAM